MVEQPRDLPLEGTIMPFTESRGRPKILMGGIEEPGCRVGVFASMGGKQTDGSWQTHQPILLAQRDGKWHVWHRTEINSYIEIDNLKSRSQTMNERDVRVYNKNLRCPNRGASHYPTQVDPLQKYKCTICNVPAFWSVWCCSRTSGRIINLCKKCTHNGVKEKSNRAKCKLGDTIGTNRMVYEVRPPTRGGCERTPSSLWIKLRINTENLGMLEKMPIQYYRWSVLDDSQVVIADSSKF